jgi:F420-non-reducing hydrogenase iron-sulfur subunit
MNHLQPSGTPAGSPTKRSFKPRIVLFQCRFNHYSTADLQQIENLTTAHVKCIQVPCAGRISPLFILNAVQGGADGIAVSGCRPGVCHFKQGNLGSRRQLAAFRDLLIHVGMAPERLRFVWMDPADRGRLVAEIDALRAAVQNLGPARHLVTRATLPFAMEVN